MDGSPLIAVDIVNADGGLIDGLVSVHDPSPSIPLHESAIIQQAAAFREVAYVLFRRFSDERSSQPVAFVVDNQDERLSNDDLAQLHNALWLHGTTPLVYVSWPARIDVLTCVRGPDFWQGEEYIYHPAAQLEVASKVETQLQQKRRFSAHRLTDGTFWEDPQNHSLSNHEKAAHQSLIQAIVETDEALDGAEHPELRRLLLLMVLIKYLEDRKVFPRPAWFGQYHKGARSFFEVLKGGDPDSVKRLLQTLEDKFNGDVFALPAGTRLTKTALREFATLVEAKTLNRQRYLWAPFSFAHLPVEVISHLYQQFVQGSTAVYTPPFLAALLLDFVMPWERLSGQERILDPACGSGVFLVGAFRRLVAARRTLSPNVEELKAVLRDQVFGVELDSSAVDLSAFSLALAVCDCLQPNVIWNELRFDRLRDRNLLEADFFDCRPIEDADEEEADDKKSIGRFDIIIGNPPFESKFSQSAWLAAAESGLERGTIPDNQIAYLFLDQCARFLRAGGQLCLVQPSGFLYNLQSHDFRSIIAQTRGLHTILDFTSIRGLFGGGGADPKTVAVLLGPEADRPIMHLTFRRTYEASEHIGFELDYYDRHRLDIDMISRNPAAGRVGLLGGGRLRDILERFQNLQTLASFAERHGWEYGEGFIAGKSGRRAKAPFLTGMQCLPSSALGPSGIDTSKLDTVAETEFRSAYSERRYAPPLLLIKKHEKLHSDVWRGSSLAYRAQIVGLHPKNGDEREFGRLVEFFSSNKRVLRLAVALNGSRGLAAKATAIEKQDIDNLPCPESEEELSLTHWEKVLQDDVLEFMLEFVRLGQNSCLLQESAGVDDMKSYSEVYCRMLGSMYDNLRARDAVLLDGFICQPFFFGEEPAVKWLDRDCEPYIRNLVFDNSMASLRTVRIVRFYHENVIFIVKPDRLRYWIKSTAIRDADDTLVDLRQQGY